MDPADRYGTNMESKAEAARAVLAELFERHPVPGDKAWKQRGVSRVKRRREEMLVAATEGRLRIDNPMHYFEWTVVAARCRIPQHELKAVMMLIYG